MKHISVFLLFVLILSFHAVSQDQVLLTIDGNPVMKSEFERIYHKNSNVQGYENKTPAQYLDLYINFKLKVLEAKKLGFDTLPNFVNELNGYREQLARPYLQDRSLIDKLVRQAYDRTLTEVNASHIMIKLPSNPLPSDTLTAYNKAMEIRNRLLKGESFEKLAREMSDDPAGKISSGNLGWFSAFTMVYPFENGAYNTKKGEYSYPVRSRYGYHIIKVNDFRKALGEIKLAHIMVKVNPNDNYETMAAKKAKMMECYQLLQSGSKFSEMVTKYSEDASAARNGGQMRWLRSGELPAEIENVVFALEDSGSYTPPVESEFGWHIFELQGKRPIASFDDLKPRLEERLMMDERGKYTERAFIDRLKKEYGYMDYPENVVMVTEVIDSSVYSGNLNTAVAENMIEPVFKIGDQEYTQRDLVEFIARSKRYNVKEDIRTIVNKKMDEMVYQELFNLEKSQLESKYPAFKYLIEEYHDGILLFNIMDEKVWSRAAEDTAGLRSWYDQHPGDYVWQERADLSIYTIQQTSLFKPLVKLASKRIKSPMTDDAFRKALCGNDSVSCVEMTYLKIEKDEPMPLGGFIWKKGYIKPVTEGKAMKVLAVNRILPPEKKTFGETQGQVTADYQNYLDTKWIEELRARYAVNIDQAVLNQIK